MMRYSACLLLSAGVWFAKAQTRGDSIRLAIDRQMAAYPEQTMKDLYKSFFQDAFGPGHLMAEGEEGLKRMTAYLRSECEEAKNDPICGPDYEQTGWHGRFYRVNLSVINDGRVPFDTFLKAFIESARQFTLPDMADWRKEWAEIECEVIAKRIALPQLAADTAAIHQLLAKGEYVSHHSEHFERIYYPHYRLIEQGVFEREIRPLLGDR